MLDVIGAGATATSDQDWHELFYFVLYVRSSFS
jgi:hypothetical protein